MKPHVRAGLWAGFITALMTTIFLFIGGSAGFLPDRMNLSGMAVYVIPTVHPILAQAVGAINHVVAGSAIGFLYGWLVPRLSILTGVAFLMISWLSLMLIALPAIGQGLFGIHGGSALAIWTFVLHVIFGAAMGRLARLKLSMIGLGG
ncbi:hypothetical protein [Mesorhizobium sp.]|uniref:hypothetical protein n=1 Tax=Mesorhizobium sp. TaxID=1871066 RepID=UPI0011FFF730|nr:hypothetical protein [Mesorhizobium sp.]TIP18458.1 MAG: hypothetical protein E5X66_15885 [Mesorhizobium sp.]